MADFPMDPNLVIDDDYITDALGTQIESYLKRVEEYYNKYIESIKSNIEITAGYDYQFWKYTNAAYLELNDMTPAEQQAASAADDQRHVLLSYYGRLNYSYDGKYLLSASIRRDGSSRFSKDNRWGSFPSVALGWRVSEEGFFKGLKPIFNNLKLRASFGVTGQQDGIANYSYLPLYTESQSGAYYMFGGTPIHTYRPAAYNSNLKWETTKAWNFGFDFGIIGDRVTGSFDYYNRKTEDLLATVPVAAGTNFNKQMLSNVGNIKSKGVEVSISATPIKKENWEWNVSANATYQKTEITNLRLNDLAESPNTPAGAIESHYVQVLSEGYAPYSYYVYKQIYDEKGMPIEGLYADLNGDGVVDSNDLYHYHSPAPDWIFGFSTSLRWKKLTLSTSLRANVGNYLYNGMAMNTGAWETMSYNDYQLNRLNNSYMTTRFQKRQHESDHYVENASFLKMDNIQLSYNFGQVCKWFSMNASLMVQNVFTITNYKGVDPETGLGEFWLDPNDHSQGVTNSYSKAGKGIVGKAVPDVLGGLTNTFRYKDFDLSFMISYQFGADMFDYPGYFLTYSDGVRIGTFNVHSAVEGNYWKQPGDVVDFPKPIYGNPYRSDKFSSREIKSTDNIRVRDITLGYNIPAFKKYINTLRVYFRTTNPFMIYCATKNVDPDVDVNGYRQTDTPPTRQFLFGLNVSF